MEEARKDVFWYIEMFYNKKDDVLHCGTKR